MIKFTHRGDFSKAERFLKKAKDKDFRPILEKYAREGITALQLSTPKDTGVTSESWYYEVAKTNSGFSIYWKNKHLVSGLPIVILLQYGHGTRSGGFVAGRDFINPPMRPLFDKIAENLWKEVSSL